MQNLKTPDACASCTVTRLIPDPSDQSTDLLRFSLRLSDRHLACVIKLKHFLLYPPLAALDLCLADSNLYEDDKSHFRVLDA